MRVVDERGEFAEALAARAARGQGRVRRRPRAAREVRRAAAPHRDPGLRRHARQRRAPVRARLLGPAPPPEGHRGGAGARHDPATRAPRWARPRCAAAKAIGYAGAGTVEFLADARTATLLLHGDEHPPAGRAPGHRDDHRPRSGRVAARASRPASRCRSTQDELRDRRPRHRGPPLRRGSRRATSCRRPARCVICACRRRRACARRHRRARRATTITPFYDPDDRPR